ncbi:phage tail protein [Cellulosilyticum ruminicola]|uniref:phage tail protein n=1 Tax=Cellulosilyticum ruminicola TaxID=425254 RepID=UPI0006D0D37B|nr:phage tail protein [Cellulosilyticum ruminicola]
MADYPFRKFRFKVDCGGINVAGFSEVSAPDVTVDVIKYREGDYPTPDYIKQPGLIEYSNITLKKGVTSSLAFFNWISDIRNGKIERHDLTISLLDETGTKEVAVWTVTNAWPCKYRSTDFNATSGTEVAIEEVELACESVVRKS